MIVQWALSSAFACAAWLAVDSPNPSEKLLAALLAGWFGMRLVMFCWVWARHGRNAARSMRMDQSDDYAAKVTRAAFRAPRRWNGQP